MRFMMIALFFLATLLIFGQATASDNTSTTPVGVRVYDDTRLPIGTLIWANISDGVYGQCTTHRVPTVRVPYAPVVNPSCFSSSSTKAIDPKVYEQFSKAVVTGYDLSDIGYGKKLFIYRITWVARDDLTFDSFVPRTLVFKMLNISDWRTEYSQFIALK